MNMNMKIEETGNFDLLDKKDLYKLVASNNTVITNVLSKVSTHDSCFFSLYFFDWVCCILFFIQVVFKSSFIVFVLFFVLLFITNLI